LKDGGHGRPIESSVAVRFPQRNSFIAGFLSALILVTVVYIWNRSGMLGGAHAESPNGMHELSVMAPLSPKSGGSYTIQLIDLKTSNVVRRMVVSLPRSEQTVALHGGGGLLVWDPASSFVDVEIDGIKSIRVWVP
jgi:hypothetical protein